MAGIGFGSSDSKSTGRQGSQIQFPKQFVLDQHAALGGPLTIADLFKLAPQSHSLFGYGPTQAQTPGGPYSLGFGAPGATPPPIAGPSAPGAPTPPGQPSLPAPTTPAPSGSLGSSPVPSAPAGQGQTYSLNALTTAYFNDPEKVMDLPRLIRQSGLDPNGFTYDQLSGAIGKARSYGFSGRSQGNFAKVLAGLQQDNKLTDTFAGGKGTGIF